MDQLPSNQAVVTSLDISPRKTSRITLPKLDQADLRHRLDERNKQQKAMQEQAANDRREGRKKGLLTRGTIEGLRACNLLQLKAARKLITKFERDQKLPPRLVECYRSQTIKVLAEKSVRNKRYTLELQRTSRRRGKVYVNGPYAWVHHRDGNVIHHQYLGNKSLSTELPRHVWPLFRPHMKSEETQSLIARSNAKWAARGDDD